MHAELRIRTTVLPGHRIEVAAPELVEGEAVEVTVTPAAKQVRRFASVVEFLATLPRGPRSAPTWEEFERQFEEERNSWER